MAEKLNFEELNNIQRYSQFAVFKVQPLAVHEGEAEIAADAQEFFTKMANSGLITVRGLYDLAGCRAEADFMIWWHAEQWEDIQKALTSFRRETKLGRKSTAVWFGNGLHRPSEFNKSHLPSFIMGEDPGAWICVYPFVRSYDWYVMDAKDRRRILAEHGRQARGYPDVRANTVPSFTLGDYEWMLAFEAPELHRIVDLMHDMRYTEARLHVREELPFFTGRRVTDLAELIKALP
ncbi:chlorite dismutase family protein [Corynebacterium sp. ES2794-CONJ1]|uniref:hydrogen peroxide-dependent heme synthase n=1 Tax=unclassified Corynebacterium TaxID=2624378 RepID=UPI0021672418|nr:MULTISPECIES: hydrogen peroxide-dependent heme synthase [unclassified Corynebacterium]MCS4489207.1 chlorite dismutase family protein [Corynebacterium sp. ES2775-CONJ]MCS4491020.1 chlorite dismutase family protein [Corynebacterium sp. ES2715-CONJ3]MCS4531099.1 chlorite dismutase family protein [Corynebacterium sp. ES2730-CONJ]MCU9518466.1 chlorite dismutase family protein [Corynebacterium sp. ES2794-CONJ1]